MKRPFGGVTATVVYPETFVSHDCNINQSVVYLLPHIVKKTLNMIQNQTNIKTERQGFNNAIRINLGGIGCVRIRLYRICQIMFKTFWNLSTLNQNDNNI